MFNDEEEQEVENDHPHFLNIDFTIFLNYMSVKHKNNLLKDRKQIYSISLDPMIDK